MGTILDSFVWYYVKGLKLYDDDFKDPGSLGRNTDVKKDSIQIKMNSQNEIELPLISNSGNVENK